MGFTGWISITVSPMATFDMLREFWVDECYLNTVDQICQSVKKWALCTESINSGKTYVKNPLVLHREKIR